MFLDRLVNLVTGLGTSKDKRYSTAFQLNLVTQDELDAAHRSDWLARKVVDIIPADMLRKMRLWQAEKDQIEALEKAEKALGLQFKVKSALQLSRLYGGAGIVMGVRGAESGKELKPDTVRKGDLQYIHVLSRYELSAGGEMIRDIESPWYGEPEYYQVTTTGNQPLRIHPSRVVRFDGAPILNRDAQTDGWGDSVLQVVYDAIQNAASSQEHVAAMIPEAKIDVIHVPGLSDQLSTQEGTTRLTNRFQLAQTIKGMFGFTLLEGNGVDEGEVWHQKTMNFAHFPDLLQNFLQVASGAADIPVTRLLGQSPAGMSATGESDLKNYYDNIAAQRDNDLTHRLARLDEVLIRSALGSRDPSIHYAWPSLWQQEPQELAEIEVSRATAVEKIAATGLVPSRALAAALTNSMIDSGQWPGLEQGLEEFEEETGDFDPDAGRGDVEEDPSGIADAAPRTLYVRRNVVNADEIIAWAKDQGLLTTLAPESLHVTIAFSRKAVDWMKTGQPWQEEIVIPAGGARLIEKFGEATVLLFNSSELSWRHEEIKRAGATWDHPEYQPHITVTYSNPFEIKSLEAYQGQIVLGPEVFEEVDEDWLAGVVER